MEIKTALGHQVSQEFCKVFRFFVLVLTVFSVTLAAFSSVCQRKCIYAFAS